MAECLFIKADEVVKMLGVSQSEAYRIIKKLNEEMAAKGYITIQEYMDTRAYIISRLDPFQVQKDRCDRCGKPGFDYALKERTKRF